MAEGAQAGSGFANRIGPRLKNRLALNSKAKQDRAENENNCRRCKTNRDNGSIPTVATQYAVRLLNADNL